MKRFSTALLITLFVFSAVNYTSLAKNSDSGALNKTSYRLKWAGKKAMKEARTFEKEFLKVVDKVSPAFVRLPNGSGVSISPDGYALTNHHVIQLLKPGKPFQVQIPGGKKFDAIVLGSDAFGDIAVIKILKTKNHPYVELGDSDKVRVGQYGLVLGNPHNLATDGDPVVSVGVISAVHCYQGSYSDAIQVDAAVNPGNSGGPLFTMDGKLVGINGRIATRNPTKSNSRVGYAIPSNQIKKFIEGLKKGNMEHGTIYGLDVDHAEKNGTGVIINKVLPNSTADKAGFKKDDLITEIDGYKIFNYYRLLGVLGIYPVGSKVSFKIKRGSEIIKLAVALEKRKAVSAVPKRSVNNTPYLGILFSPTTTEGGIQIEKVLEGSGAAEAGLHAGDILTHFEGKEVKTPQELINMIKSKKIGDKVMIKVKRGVQIVDFTVKLGARPKK